MLTIKTFPNLSNLRGYVQEPQSSMEGKEGVFGHSKGILVSAGSGLYPEPTLTPSLIVLDRDGVINEDSEHFVKSLEEFIFIPRSIEAIVLLQHLGYTVVVATNQSGIARGYFSQETLQAMHDALDRALCAQGGKALHYFVCPHGPNEACVCRKPKTGLWEQIGARYGMDALRHAISVGDSLRDLEAARHFTKRLILVETGKGVLQKQRLPSEWEVHVLPTLYDFAQLQYEVNHA